MDMTCLEKLKRQKDEGKLSLDKYFDLAWDFYKENSLPIMEQYYWYLTGLEGDALSDYDVEKWEAVEFLTEHRVEVYLEYVKNRDLYDDFDFDFLYYEENYGIFTSVNLLIDFVDYFYQ